MKRAAFSFTIVFALFWILLTPVSANDGLIVTIFDVGKADAMLLQWDDLAVMIDTGENKDGPALADKLRALGVTSLDALILTHFDKDHVGGADTIIGAFPVAQVFEPDYAKESKQRTQYENALARAGIAPTRLSSATTLTLGDQTFSVKTAGLHGYDEENDLSLVIRLEYGDTSFLFVGDAENPRLRELLTGEDLASTFLKVPHHGGFEDLTDAFVSAVSPEIAVITSSGSEPEDPRVVEILKNHGAAVLLTRDGDIRVTSDGAHLTAEQIPGISSFD